MDEFRQFGSIISVTTDAILARCMSSPQPPGENRGRTVNRVEKIIGSAEKNRVGSGTGTTGIFFTPRALSPFLRPAPKVFLHKSFVLFGTEFILISLISLSVNFHKTSSRHFENFGFVIFTCR